jgi:general stress protein YciG
MATGKSSSKRGFAAMSPEKQREIAAKGGRASHGGGRPAQAKSRNSSGR